MDLEELWQLVRSIPEGKVSSYGDVGQALSTPSSGFQVGRWMARCPEGVPWWRVVSKQGHFPVGKRDPKLEMEQREILEKEGVEVQDGQVEMACFAFYP